MTVGYGKKYRNHMQERVTLSPDRGSEGGPMPATWHSTQPSPTHKRRTMGGSIGKTKPRFPGQSPLISAFQSKEKFPTAGMSQERNLESPDLAPGTGTNFKPSAVGMPQKVKTFSVKRD